MKRRTLPITGTGMKDETVAPKAKTLLFLVDQGVAGLLAFCVDAYCRKRPSLTILGDHGGTAAEDFPRFLEGELHFVGVNAL